MIIPTLIPYEKLTEGQCQYICEHLIGVPLSIDWALEVLPAVSYEDEESHHEIMRYGEGENVPMYLERLRDEWTYLLAKSQWVADNEGHRNKRLLAAITLRHPDVIDVQGASMLESRYFDFQSCYPLTAVDVFPHRFNLIFDHFIAPLAVLSGDANKLPGLGIEEGIPTPSVGRDRDLLAAVWVALGGIAHAYTPPIGLASEVEMGRWEWDTEKITPGYWVNRVSDFISWCSGRFGEKKVQEWRHKAHEFDEGLWNMSQDDIEDDDDDPLDDDDYFDPIDDDYTPEEVERMGEEQSTDELLNMIFCSENGKVLLSPKVEKNLDAAVEKISKDIYRILKRLVHQKEGNDAEEGGDDAGKKKKKK